MTPTRMSPTLRQLEILVAIADHGGFGAAADVLGMSQSSVSHSLSSLERTVQGELVHRVAPVRPTRLGEALLPHARATLAGARAFDIAAAAHRGANTAAPIALAVPPTAAHGLLPDLMVLWRERLPHVQVKIFEGFDEELGRWLEDGTVDAAVLIDPDPVPPGAVTLATDTFHAVVRRDHPLAGQNSIDLADLLDDPLLSSTAGCEPQVRRLHSLAGLRYQPAQRIREVTTLLSMVEAGLGVAAVPSLTANLLPEALTLVPLLPRLDRHLVLTGPTTRPWHPYVTAVRDVCENHTRSQQA